jgi:polysaccharide chain length determinant protein (PEP-CTERM system associated)
MLGHRDLILEDYAGILKRRFLVILTSTLVFLGVGVGITRVVPPQFISTTLVLIEQQKVPEDYVKPVVDEDLTARLSSMKEQILSRSRIQPIIEQFNLFNSDKNTMDDRILLTQKAIGIKPIPSSEASQGMPGFTISFKANDAHTAQQVCGAIESLFVSENQTDRQQTAEGTTDFLKQQLADSKKNLDDQDAKLAAFQQKYLGKLPEQENSNSNTLQALTTQLDASTQSLNRLQQDETFLQAMVTQQSHDLQRAEPATTAALDDRRAQLKALMAQKEELESLYTPDHPDVVAISRKIEELQAEIVNMPAQTTPGTAIAVPDTPQLQQLKAQLRGAQQAVAAAKDEQAHIEQQVRTYESRIDSSPVVEEEYKQVTRDHDTALQFYNTLLTKMNESTMATALERRQQGEQFHVMDAPNLPDEPAFPNIRIFAGGGLAFGLMLGLLIAGLQEYRDTSLRNERDIWAFTKLPTLAIISHMGDLSESGASGHRGDIFSSGAKSIESVNG